jgi:hypothetical protein
MAMKAYSIFIFLFIFGVVSGSLNTLAIFDVNMPQNNVNTVNQADVMDLSNTASTAGLNPFFIFYIIQSFGKVMFTGILTCATILPLIVGFLSFLPLPQAIAIGMIFQAPVWIVCAFGIYQLVTGYNMGGME